MEDKPRRAQSESEHMKLECQRFINDPSINLNACLNDDLKAKLLNFDIHEEDGRTLAELKALAMQTRSETEVSKQKVKELKKMSDWYDGVRAAMEELGGMKILTIEHSSGGGKKPIDSKRNETNIAPSIIVKVEMLKEYTLQIVLDSIASPLDRNSTISEGVLNQKEKLRVASAIFLGDSMIRAETENEINSAHAGLEGKMPQLDDLVELSHMLHYEGEGLRFVLREALARIRGAQLRIEELAILRKRYLAKIMKGGEEVVCSLNEGVTVMLRLTVDSPMLPGSAYIEQMVGVGGWDKDTLENMRVRINSSRRRGPIEIVEAVVNELNDITQEHPRTPSLPSRADAAAFSYGEI
mmetsp:Transcript_37384/g.45080  ORF Transcript_37384/g.45080 Transcript_37384/m.45080 type:complete len:354 (+) Transcript_37384:428-1489(+)